MSNAAVTTHPLTVVVGPGTGYWILRLGAALCFIGHGAFGFITKAAWLPYFGVVGIPERWAWGMMPLVGAVDVLAGMAVLFAPARLPLLYMVLWATWTALLRPLAGESVFETLERAGNYGVPLALLLLAGLPRRWPDLFHRLEPPPADQVVDGGLIRVLQWTTCLLLAGHGALGAIGRKSLLVEHYAVIGLPPSAVVVAGWFELALAGWILLRPGVGIALLVALWKVATEWLFVVADAPVWEFVERAGSYAAPLALAVLLLRREAPPGSAGARGRGPGDQSP